MFLCTSKLNICTFYTFNESFMFQFQAILEKRINHLEDSNKLLPKNKTGSVMWGGEFSSITISMIIGDDSWKLKYEELKEQTYCTICMENEKNVVLGEFFSLNPNILCQIIYSIKGILT